MGRPRLYHTLEEKKAAVRQNSSNYYWSHPKRIAKRRKKARDVREKEGKDLDLSNQTVAMNDSDACGPSGTTANSKPVLPKRVTSTPVLLVDAHGPSQKGTSSRCTRCNEEVAPKRTLVTRKARAALDRYHEMVVNVEEDIKNMFEGGTLRLFLTIICVRFEAQRHDLGNAFRSLEKKLEPFNRHQETLQVALDGVLNSHGYGSDYKRGEGVQKTVKNVIGHLQGILCDAMADPVDFIDRYHSGLLEFQLELPA